MKKLEHKYFKIVAPMVVMLFAFLFMMNGLSALYSQPQKSTSIEPTKVTDDDTSSAAPLVLKTYAGSEEDIDTPMEDITTSTDEEEVTGITIGKEEDFDIGEVKASVWGKEEEPAKKPAQEDELESIKQVEDKIGEMERIRAEDNSNIAVRLYMAGEVDKALEYFKKALEIDPKNIGIRYNYATTYRNLGVKDKAIEQYEKILEIDPKFKFAQQAIDSIKGVGSGEKTEVSAAEAFEAEKEVEKTE